MPIDIWYAAPPADKGLPAAHHHITGYGCQFWGYFGVTLSNSLSISAAHITPKWTSIIVYLSSDLNFGVTECDPFAGGVGASDLKSYGIIKISGLNNPKIDTHNEISVSCFEFKYDGGRRLTLVGGAADLKYNGIIEISGPINPKIDTHNIISVISFEF